MCPGSLAASFVAGSLLCGEAIAFWVLSVFDPGESKKKGHVEYFQSEEVRPYFSWAFGWFLSLFMGGLSMLFGALELEQYHLPIWCAIWLCYAFFLAAAVYCVGCWLASTYLHKRRNLTNPSKYRREKWSSVFLIVVFFAGCEYAVHETQYHLELVRLEGRLVPACDGLRFPFCGFGSLPQGVMALEFGDGSRGVVGGLPTMILASRQYGNIMGLFRPEGEDYIALYMDILGRDGKIIARFDDRGKFIVSPNQTLEMVRDDKSSLKIIDEFGDEVLNVRYANRQLIKISGIIRLPGREPFAIGLRSLAGNGLGCMSNGGNEKTILILIP